jgi:nitroreductase
MHKQEEIAMDVYEAIQSRRGVRDFEAKSIDETIIKKIISSGLKAPSNNHLSE